MNASYEHRPQGLAVAIGFIVSGNLVLSKRARTSDEGLY